MMAVNIHSWIDKLAGVTGRGRGRIVSELCAQTGWSRDTAYRRLRAAGWQSARKTRSDCGSSSLGEDTLHKMGALLQQSQRKDGRNPMTVRRARGILLDNGEDIRITDSQVARILRDYGLDKASLKAAEPHQSLRSLYPNHCHLVDPSLALWYFTPQKQLRIISAEEHYKNKDYFEGRKIENKCWRYVLVDHYSRSVCIKYYESAGENMLNLWDFLLYAWGPKTEELYAFCGVPDLIVWDKGSANSSRPISRALESLGVEFWAHQAGAPRAKGAVETMNRHWEGWLEVTLRYEPVSSLAELNALAEKYSAALNANSFEHHDSRIVVHGHNLGSRLDIWQAITEEQLRYLPEDRICRSLLTTEPEERKLDGSLCASYRGYAVKGPRRYSLAGLPGVEVGKAVMAQPLIYTGTDTVRFTWRLPKYQGGDAVSYDIEPIRMDSAGFPLTAPVLGEEFQALPKTAGQHRREAVADKTVLEEIKTHSVVKQRPVEVAELPQGKAIDLQTQVLSIAQNTLPVRPEVIHSGDIRYSVTEAVQRIRSELGGLPSGLAARLRSAYPHGLSGAEIQEQIHQNQANRQEAI
ncbi:transposase [Candidatus Haliotispira prima]|uniref:Transposase n=1 Tax=Candidatus Haliotispira prima TaxID=3034016 RepID=A0ABY8MEH1_9SPIO|nr:transposase [Candidatus Haliotispira prima]